MAGDVEGFSLLEMRDLDKLKSKLEVVMEKRMYDTCRLNITALLVRLVQTIAKCLGIKYRDLCFQERIYCYLLAYTTICSTLIIDCTNCGTSPYS